MKYHLDYFTEKFRHFPRWLELVVLGTTQGHFAFDFSDCGIDAANMSVATNSPVYHKAFLKKYRKRIKKGAVVLITLEYPIFLCGIRQRTELNVQYARTLFGYHPVQPLRRQILYRLFPYHYVKSSLYEGLIADAKRNRIRNRLKTYEINYRVRQLIKGWENETYPLKIEEYEYSKQTEVRRKRMDWSIRIIEDTILFCRTCGWKPVIVGLPYSEELNFVVSRDFVKDCFYSCITQIQSDTQISFLDYSTDSDFLSIQNYMDIWYLNDIGRKKITERVLKDLGMGNCI